MYVIFILAVVDGAVKILRRVILEQSCFCRKSMLYVNPHDKRMLYVNPHDKRMLRNGWTSPNKPCPRHFGHIHKLPGISFFDTEFGSPIPFPGMFPITARFKHFFYSANLFPIPTAFRGGRVNLVGSVLYFCNIRTLGASGGFLFSGAFSQLALLFKSVIRLITGAHFSFYDDCEQKTSACST